MVSFAPATSENARFGKECMPTLYERAMKEWCFVSKLALSDTFKVQNTNVDGVEKLKKYIKESFKAKDYDIDKKGIYLNIRNAPIKTTQKGTRYFVYKNVIFVLVTDIAKIFGSAFETIKKYINHSTLDFAFDDYHDYQINIKASNSKQRSALCVPLDFMIYRCPAWGYFNLGTLVDDILNDINNQIKTNIENQDEVNMNTKKSLAVVKHLSNIVEIGGIIFINHEGEMYVSCRSLCILADNFPYKYLKWEGFNYTKLPYHLHWDTVEKKKKIIRKKEKCQSSLVCIPLGEIWEYSSYINISVNNDPCKYRKGISKVYVDNAVILAKEFLFREDKNMSEENINQEQGTMTTGVFMDKVKNYSKYTIEGMEKLCYSYNTLCKDYNNLSNDYKETTSKLQNCEEEILRLREKARKYDALIELIKQE